MHKTRKFLFLFLIMATLYSCSKEEVDIPSKDSDIDILADQLSSDQRLIDVFASKKVIEFLVFDAQKDLLESDKTVFLSVYEEALYSNDFMKIATLLNTKESVIKEFFFDYVSNTKALAVDFPQIPNLSNKESLDLDSLVLSKDYVKAAIEDKYLTLIDTMTLSYSKKSDVRCALRYIICTIKVGGLSISGALLCSAVAPEWVIACVGFAEAGAVGSFAQCTQNFLGCIKK
ncbi:hypothetical protein [Aquimarina latercula]|uniref:hypothetical protein n=1 Tax=Aquimarina latercula TaxID=987 RepID=UPI0003FCA24F|nr:hypothetical protein [Aquimarina latercula]